MTCTKTFIGVGIVVLASSMAMALEEGFHRFAYPGYEDTPLIAGTLFRVHQKGRAQPPRVVPEHRLEAGANPAPADATILFDGHTVDSFQNTAWQIKDGALVAGQGNLVTRAAYGDCQIHLEWRAPVPPSGKPNNMGNSGLFLMGLYELQIFDSYSCRIYADGSAAAIYGQAPPLVNVCAAPGQWQSYDVVFQAPVFKDGSLLKAARITVFHNGVLVHHHTKILGPTRHRSAKPYVEHPARLPLMIQGHDSPVAFRNMWIRDL